MAKKSNSGRGAMEVAVLVFAHIQAEPGRWNAVALAEALGETNTRVSDAINAIERAGWRKRLDGRWRVTFTREAL